MDTAQYYISMDPLQNFRYYLQLWDLTIKSALMSCAVGISTVIVYVILAHKTLRTKANIYLVHYAIANIGLYGGIPIIGLFMDYVAHVSNKKNFLFCSYTVDGLAVTATQAWGVVLAFNYVSACYSNKLTWLYRHIEKYLVFFLYIFYFSEFLFIHLPCLQNKLFIDQIGLCTCITLLILKLIAQIVIWCTKSNQICLHLAYSWQISNIIVYSWIPMLVFYVLFKLHVVQNGSDVFMFAVSITARIFQYGQPVVVFVYLALKHNNFGLKLLKLFLRT